MAVIIRVKRGTTTQWNNSTTPLSPGELGYDLTSKVIKIGDGTTLWNNLNPLNKFEIDEISQDAIYGALTNFVSTGENVTVEYNDAENFIKLDTGPNVVLVSDLATAITEANEYTDLAVASLGNSIDGQYVPTSAVGNLNGVAPLDADSLIPDQYIPAGIARDSEIVTSYNDLTDKPAIALGAVKWTANHYQLEGGENTRYLAGDIVWDGGNIYVANFDNESLPTTNTQYWSLVGPGNRLNIDGRDIPNILWDNIGNKPTLFDGSYNSLTNLPTLFSGSYADLTDKPSLFDGDYASLTNLPILFSGSYNDLTDKPTIPDLTGYATETYVNTAVSNLVDSAPETLNTLNELAAALGDDANYATTISTALGNKLDSSTAATTYLTQTNASTTYAPIENPTFTGTVSGVTKSMVGLGNVDNTSDADKPVSTATQTALNAKLSLTDPALDYYITNAGMGSYMVNGVSNGTLYFEKGKKYRIHVNANGHPFWIQTVSGGYSSANVYNAGIANNGTQNGHIIIELAQDAPQLYYACQYHSSMAGSIFVGSRSTTSKAIADLSNVDNTSDVNKPISTATQTALDLKSDEKISYVSESGTSRTISASDLYKVIHTSSGSAVTITIPDDTGDLLFPIGSYLEIRQMGAGQVTVSTTSPATAVAPDNAFKTRVQYSSIIIEKHQANSWYVTGDTTA
jgi:hypothetical protein